ncbi:MAG: hypothetical protein BWY66_02901 [bacterium ADurb.Bin374]|nr:MAG: hypothetical protein BWY66_02901 [bacterium ADurb.Bin374]
MFCVRRRSADDEHVACAGEGDVQLASLFPGRCGFVGGEEGGQNIVRTAADIALMCDQPLFPGHVQPLLPFERAGPQTGQEHDGKLETLRLVNGEDLDGFALFETESRLVFVDSRFERLLMVGEEVPKCREHTVGLESPDDADEFREVVFEPAPPEVVRLGCGMLEEPRLLENGVDEVQDAERAAHRLKPDEQTSEGADPFRQRFFREGEQIREQADALLAPFTEQTRQFFVGKAVLRPCQDRRERGIVVRPHQQLQKREDGGDLVAGVEAEAAGHDIGNAARQQGVFVGARQPGDRVDDDGAVAVGQRPRAGPVLDAQPAADERPDHVGDGVGFRIPGLRRGQKTGDGLRSE